MMTRERWQRIDQLFHAVLERDPSEQEAFLDEACGGDGDLRHEVATLLAAEAEADTVKLKLPAEVAAEMVAEDQTRPIIGERIGRYKILSLLGAGGMGDVYLAEDKRLGRKVALKLLKESFVQDAERVRRFEQEARAASALNQPNIITIHEIGQVDSKYYIVTERVTGATLRQQMTNGKLKIGAALDLASQVASALEAAHAAGIVHRDIKPENVMVRPDGLVKVLDFGLAKLTVLNRAIADTNAPTVNRSLTEPGQVMGTPSYMSPEQARGVGVDARSDIFSLGVVLYEMITGLRPFGGETPTDVVVSIVQQEPDPLTCYTPEAPPELDQIVARALRKDRDERYQTASELLADLKGLKRQLELDPAPGHVKEATANIIQSKARRNWLSALAAGMTNIVKRYQWRAILVLAVVTLSGIGLLYFVLKSPLPPKVTDYKQITRGGLWKVRRTLYRMSSSLVTDGPRLYFSESSGLTQVSSIGGETVAIPASFPDAAVGDISPDRSELLVSRGDSEFEGSLWVVPVLGGAPRRLGDLLGHDATWSPDGLQIVYANGSALYLAKSDGSESRKLVTIDGRPYWPRWSPDRSRLRFTVVDNRSASLWEVAADGTNAHPLLPGWNSPANECCGNWTADGRYFVFQSTRNRGTHIWARREQASLFQRASREPIQLTVGPLNYYAPVPSQDGKKLFVVAEQQRGELARYDAKTQQLASYMQGISAEHLDFSRDREWIAYVTYPEGSLWRSKADGGERRRLSSPPMRAALPRWSPDGKQIVFMASIPGKGWKTYLISTDGGSPQKLMPDERIEFDPGWAPDGNSLVFCGLTSFSPTDSAIYLLKLGTHEPYRLPDSEGLYSPRWSPDGRYIAAHPVGLQNKLLLFDITTRKWTEILSHAAGGPHWSRDGKSIYFIDFSGEWPVLFRVGIGDRSAERFAVMKDFRLASGAFGVWIGWTPDDSPLVLRDVGIQDIYALEWQTP